MVLQVVAVMHKIAMVIPGNSMLLMILVVVIVEESRIPRRSTGKSRRSYADLMMDASVRTGFGRRDWRGGRSALRRRSFVKECSDLDRHESISAAEIVFLKEIGQILVAGDRDESVEILGGQLASQAHLTPTAQVPHLFM